MKPAIVLKDSGLSRLDILETLPTLPQLSKPRQQQRPTEVPGDEGGHIRKHDAADVWRRRGDCHHVVTRQINTTCDRGVVVDYSERPV